MEEEQNGKNRLIPVYMLFGAYGPENVKTMIHVSDSNYQIESDDITNLKRLNMKSKVLDNYITSAKIENHNSDSKFEGFCKEISKVGAENGAGYVTMSKIELEIIVENNVAKPTYTKAFDANTHFAITYHK